MLQTVHEHPRAASPANTQQAVEPKGAPLCVPLAIVQRASAQQPLTVGVPFPRGMLRAPEAVALLDWQQRPQPVQAECLARWPDGSVKWLLLDFILPESADCR